MDQGIKRLCQTRPQDLLQFAMPGMEYLGTLSTDLATEPQLAVDTLFRARHQGVECAVNIEAEARTNAEMPARCFAYGARAYVVHTLPVLSIILWLQKDVRPPDSPFALRIGDWLAATWHFKSIELYNAPASAVLANGPLGLLPLIPFMQGGQSEEAIERAAHIVKERASTEELSELEGLLAVFGARVLGSSTIRALMRRVLMNTEILETSPLYREWVAEATAKGLQQGLEQGLQQGLERSLAHERAMLLALWRTRFGEPAADEVAAIEQIHEPEQLVALVAPLASAPDSAAARTHLGLGPAATE